MTVTWAWVGAVTPESARVVSLVSSSAQARLAIDVDASFSAPTYFALTSPDADNIVQLQATGLDADTSYFWAIEHDSVLDTSWIGEFTTFPTTGQPANLTFLSATCAGNLDVSDVSNHEVFDTIRNKRPRFFAHNGDLHYRDIAVSDQSLYRTAYNDVLTYNGTLGPDARQGRLYRTVPTNYIWDDHDYGPNNSDGTFVGKAAAQAAFRQCVPHYPLVESSGAIYHAFEYGRYLHIVSDVRSERSPNSAVDDGSKTMLGAAQKAWMFDLLSASDHPLLVWHMPSQWMGTSNDSWAVFTTERQEMIEIFTETGFINKMFIVSGDVHALAIDTGANSPGGIPVFQFASMDSASGSVQNHYDTGPTSPGQNRYGSIDITDDGFQITVTGTGWIGTDLWRQHSFTVGEPAPPPPEPPPPAPPIRENFEGEPLYNYVFGQARSSLVTANIPMYGVSMTRMISKGEDFTGTFQLDMTGFRNLDLKNATDPGRTFVVVERDGIPIWDGNVTSRTYQSQAKSCQIWARSIVGYPDKVVMDETFIPNGITLDGEITSLYLQLWELLQSKPECDMRVLLPEALDTGVEKTLEIQPYEKKTFGEVMREIADGDPGFDYRILTDKDPDTSEYFRVLQIGYPEITTNDPATLVFDYPGSITNYWMTEAVGEAGTNIFGTGAGEGEDQVRSDITFQELIDGGYLRWDVEVNYTEISDQSILDAIILQQSKNLKVPKRRYTVEAHGGKYPKLGSYQPGDACILAIEDPMHPIPSRYTTRIVGWRMSPPSDSDQEKVSLYFVGSDLGA